MTLTPERIAELRAHAANLNESATTIDPYGLRDSSAKITELLDAYEALASERDRYEKALTEIAATTAGPPDHALAMVANRLRDIARRALAAGEGEKT